MPNGCGEPAIILGARFRLRVGHKITCKMNIGMIPVFLGISVNLKNNVSQEIIQVHGKWLCLTSNNAGVKIPDPGRPGKLLAR